MNWLALGSEENSIVCNNDGICSGEESCNCDDCSLKTDHCGFDTTSGQLLCTKNTPTLTDVEGIAQSNLLQ